MDKDNLDIHSILSGLTTETLQIARAETFQQLISALCLTVVGLCLAIIGFVGLTLKLGRLVKFNILFAVHPITLLFTSKRNSTKSVLEIISK
jgi:hypothetical protein